MKFQNIYSNPEKPVISFELFPPKTDTAMENLLHVLPDLAGLRPNFMTVTYGAGGSTRTRTLEIAALIQNNFKIPSACHLTCVGSSRTDLDAILDQIYAAGIRNIVALRGDPPKGESSFVPAAHGYAHANELVTHIRKRERQTGQDPFGLAVAGYPEKHIEAPNMATDLANLKRKVDSGADCVITQLFYDNRHYFRFVEQAHSLGIDVPIVPGLLPVLSAKQVLRITSMCGSCLPTDMLKELEAAGDDAAKSEEIGVRRCIEQASELIDRGAPGIHFYVLNKSSHMIRIMDKIPR